MGFLTTEKCCGILSLKSGGIMLGWIPLLLSIREIIVSLKSDQPEMAGVFAVLALLFSFWIEGITHGKPAWMFPIVIFWNVALWTEIICYAISFYYHFIAPSMHPKFGTTHQNMLFMPLAIVIIWHFAAVSYSLYKQIDDANRRPMTTTIHHQRTTAGPAATTEAQPRRRPPPQQPTVHQAIVITPPSPPPSPPPSYDRIYKV